MTRQVLAIVVLAACGSQTSDKPAVESNSSYLYMRRVLLAGLPALPKDLSKLPRCDRALRQVMVFEATETAAALELQPSKPSYDWLSAKRLDEAAHGNADAAMFFKNDKHVGVIRYSEDRPPVVHDCTDGKLTTSHFTECGLDAGHAIGDLVVLDDTGKPTCAVHLALEGPASGDKHVVEMFEIQKQALADLTFYDQEPPATQSPSWYLLTRKDSQLLKGEWRIDIDGQRVADYVRTN